MFQNRILKAGARPTPMHSSIMASRTVTQLRLEVPKAPSKIPWYTWMGFNLVMAKMKMPLTTRDSSTAMIRMAQALGRGMASRLAIRSACCTVSSALSHTRIRASSPPRAAKASW